jgi:hypothetical protein
MGNENLTIAELRALTINQIERELDYCNSNDTPTVCQMISTPKGRQKIVDLVLEYVGNAGQTIGQAIVSIEAENNPKTILLQ